jgi:hypothetical protein
VVYEEEANRCGLAKWKHKQEQTVPILTDLIITQHLSVPQVHRLTMPSRAIYVVPWGTRLHPKDKYYSSLKVPSEFLGYHKDRNLSDAEHATWRAEFMHGLIEKPFWVCYSTSYIYITDNKWILQVQTITAWMIFCMDGLEVALDEAAGTFVDVLWCRFQGADADAQEILNNTQNDILNREVRACIYSNHETT